MSRFAKNLVAGTLAIPFLALAALALPGVARCAGVEAVYDPAVGSRWTIVSESRDEKAQDGKLTETTSFTRREELTFIEKAGAEYRISTVLRSYETQGGTVESTAVEALLGALRNVVVRGVLDSGGKPVRVENLEEVVAAQKQGIERVVDALTDKPAMAAKLRGLLEAVTSNSARDPDSVARWYLESLALLSVTQNTGLALGEERRTAKSSPNPFGGDPIKTNEVLRLVEADPAAAKLKLVRTISYDPAAMKEVSIALAKKLLDGSSADAMEKLMSQISLSMEDRAEFVVENGMTLSVSETSVETVNALGHSIGKQGRNQVTVAPLD
jgi:uncharacterized coiled-coil protein SlyX